MAEAREAMQHSGSKQTRRAWIRGLAEGVLVTIAADRIIKHLDKLSPVPPNPELPSGSRSADPRDWLQALFGPWQQYSAVPGTDHKDFASRSGTTAIHPDIREAYNGILPLWEGAGRSLQPVAEENLPTYVLTDPIILIGGPVSNTLSRQWQDYRRSEKTGLVERVRGRRTRRRWRFAYTLNSPTSEGPARYVNGSLHRSSPAAIEDLRRPKTPALFAVKAGRDRMLLSDYLVLSFVKNTLRSGSGASIIDVSDLHGQGNKAFARLVNDPDRLSELINQLRARAKITYTNS